MAYIEDFYDVRVGVRKKENRLSAEKFDLDHAAAGVGLAVVADGLRVGLELIDKADHVLMVGELAQGVGRVAVEVDECVIHP